MISIYIKYDLLCRAIGIVSCLVLSIAQLRAEDKVAKCPIISLPTGGDLKKAELWYQEADDESKGVLLNISASPKEGRAFMEHKGWKSFAEANDLVLASLQTEWSEKSPLDIGLFSLGDNLRASLRKAFRKPLPLLLYGSRSGANFTLSFVEKWPMDVTSWVVENPSRFLNAKLSANAPSGLIVSNGSGYQNAVECFNNLRGADRDVCILNLGKNALSYAIPLEQQFLNAALTTKGASGLYADIQTKEIIAITQLQHKKLVSSWLPNKEFLEDWGAAHQGGDLPKPKPEVIVHSMATGIDKQPELHFYMRLPPSTEATSFNGILAYCTWQKNEENLRARLLNDQDPITKYALKRNLVLLTWNTSILWKTGINTADIERARQQALVDDFDVVAKTWNDGVAHLTRKYNLPENKLVLFGYSAGAHWSHRVALRYPERFLAVAIHCGNNFDTPRRPTNLPWLVTVGARDIGSENSFVFYKRLRKVESSAVLYKAVPGQGHNIDDRVYSLVSAFFDQYIQASGPTKESSGEPLFLDCVNNLVYSSRSELLVSEDQCFATTNSDLVRSWSMSD